MDFFQGNQAANGSFENQAFYDFNNRALPVWQVLINKKIKNTIHLIIFTGFSTFLQYVQKYSINIKEFFCKGFDGCWWKLQDINFMILTGSKRLFTALKDRGMNTIRLRVWVNQMMIKPVDTAARKKLL
jgi:arabinogalactan endo-1,4-beta-galactosidase